MPWKSRREIEGDLRVFNSHGRGRIRAAVKDGQLGDGFSRAVEGEHLFAAADGGFEDAHLAARDDVQAVARLAFREQEFAGTAARGDGHRRSQGREGVSWIAYVSYSWELPLVASAATAPARSERRGLRRCFGVHRKPWATAERRATGEVPYESGPGRPAVSALDGYT